MTEREAAEQIRAAALARVAEPGTDRVRVEDYLTALGAVTGEAAIIAAGIDIETLDIPPGAALFGDQINQVLTTDTADLAAVSADSIVGAHGAAHPARVRAAARGRGGMLNGRCQGRAAPSCASAG